MRAAISLVVLGVATMLGPLTPRAETWSGGQPAAPGTDARSATAEPDSGWHGTLGLQSFYRVEDLVWSINGGSIDVRSELTWDRVQSAGLALHGRLDLPRRLTLMGELAYGRIFSGELRDSDYNGSRRTLEFSRSRSKTKRGSVIDTSLALGWERPLGARLVVVPLVGLSYHQQNYNIRDGVQLIPPTGPAPLAGLDSDYDGEWLGFFWGAELRWRLREGTALRVGYQSHHTRYKADAHFNLRSDLANPSFVHRTFAQGSTWHAGLSRALGDAWTLELLVRYRAWESDSGRTTFRFASGGVSRQRFNDVDLESGYFSLGMVYGF